MRTPLAGSLALGLAGCQGPLSTLDPGGPQAHSILALTTGMTVVGALALLFVTGLFLVALRRASSKTRSVLPLTDARRWTLWLGVGFPLAVLVSLLAATLWVGERQFAGDRALPVWRATATRWQWQFAQVNPDGSLGQSAERLVIPAGQPVIVEIASTDVIHSFWVPRLAGKMDAVPGKLNRHLIEASQPGVYHGVCAEYCGIGHDHMRFEVIAIATRKVVAGAGR